MGDEVTSTVVDELRGMSHEVRSCLEMLQNIERRLKEMRQQKAKLESQGDRMIAEQVKLAQKAEKLLAKGSELSELQQQAWEIINEGKPLSIAELPEAYLKEAERIRNRGLSVCARYGHTSGCLSCDEQKCLSHWMRRECKRLGRNLAPEYKL